VKPGVFRISVLAILVPLIASMLVTVHMVTALPVFSDTLTENSINPSFWSTDVIGSGPAVAATNQTIIVTLPPNSVNDPSQQVFRGGLQSTCWLAGDFDMQVDFKLVVWPQSSGVRVGLFIPVPPIDAVERVGFGPTEAPGLPREVYLTNFADGVKGITGTVDLSGTLRMVRSGTSLAGYYLSSGNWVLINVGPTVNTGDVRFGFAAWSHNALFGGQEAKVGFNNFIVNSGQLICPVLSFSPASGPIGTRVQISGSGFPVSTAGSGTVSVSFDDMSLGTTTDTRGTFSFTFDVPEAQSGLHFVKALDQLSGTFANSTFNVTQIATISLNLDVGTLYFPGETAAIYTLATLSGAPLDSTTLQLQLILSRPDGSTATLSSAFVGGGLFKTNYTIPAAGPVGTYVVRARAHVANVQDVSTLTTFEVKPTWLSAQGPALTVTGVALTGAVAIATVVWTKRIGRTRID
jgi:hypothetical protein